jgi:hypothetical protein
MNFRKGEKNKILPDWIRPIATDLDTQGATSDAVVGGNAADINGQ